MRFASLGSGSKGNATYISDGQTSILVDAGLSGIEIQRRLASRNLNPDDLDAIVVTHEHSDHTRGVGILSRRYKLPVYINEKTGATAGNLSVQIDKLSNAGYIGVAKSFKGKKPVTAKRVAVSDFVLSVHILFLSAGISFRVLSYDSGNVSWLMYVRNNNQSHVPTVHL